MALCQNSIFFKPALVFFCWPSIGQPTLWVVVFDKREIAITSDNRRVMLDNGQIKTLDGVKKVIPLGTMLAFMSSGLTEISTATSMIRLTEPGFLRSIARYATRGRELVFDYRVSEELLSASARKTREKIRKFTARRAELLKSTFDPRTLREEVSRLGFEIAEHLPPEEQWTRYFGMPLPLAAPSVVH